MDKHNTQHFQKLHIVRYSNKSSNLLGESPEFGRQGTAVFAVALPPSWVTAMFVNSNSIKPFVSLASVCWIPAGTASPVVKV